MESWERDPGKGTLVMNRYSHLKKEQTKTQRKIFQKLPGKFAELWLKPLLPYQVLFFFFLIASASTS